MCTHELMDLLLLHRFLVEASMADGVKGFMLADLTFSEEFVVESHSAGAPLRSAHDGSAGALARRSALSSSKRRRALWRTWRGVERGDDITQAEFGEDIRSKIRMARTPLVGGEGDWMGLEGTKDPGRRGQH